jgi:hypothetical protein
MPGWSSPTRDAGTRGLGCENLGSGRVLLAAGMQDPENRDGNLLAGMADLGSGMTPGHRASTSEDFPNHDRGSGSRVPAARRESLAGCSTLHDSARSAGLTKYRTPRAA